MTNIQTVFLPTVYVSSKTVTKDESDIEEGGAGILLQDDGDPVPSTYYIYTTKCGYAYLR